MNNKIEKLHSEIQSLKDKNKNLELRLKIAKLWMIKQIKESIKKISKNKISKLTGESKKSFARDNLEDIITSKIRNYFGDFILMNVSSSVIENIISAEIAYYELKQNPNFDGFSVVSSYHKAIDVIIEQIITKGFRRFSIKHKQTNLRKNDVLEKSFHSIVNKNYSLGIGRLYNILDNIKQEKQLFDYGLIFKKYLIKYSDLYNILLNDDFLKLFRDIMRTEIFGKKRHSGQISFVETRKARKLIIGNLKDKNSLIYMILKIQDMQY